MGWFKRTDEQGERPYLDAVTAGVWHPQMTASSFYVQVQASGLMPMYDPTGQQRDNRVAAPHPDWWRCDACRHANDWQHLACEHCGAQLPERYDEA